MYMYMYLHCAFFARFVKLTLWLAFGHCSNLMASCGALLERWRILVALVCVAANIHLRSACGYWERSLRQYCRNKWSRKQCQGRTKPGDMYSERSAIIKGIDKTTWRLLEQRWQRQQPVTNSVDTRSHRQWLMTALPLLLNHNDPVRVRVPAICYMYVRSDQHHCQTIAVVVRTYVLLSSS